MANHPKHLVVLTAAERKLLTGLLRRGTSSGLTQRRAHILLAVDVGQVIMFSHGTIRLRRCDEWHTVWLGPQALLARPSST